MSQVEELQEAQLTCEKCGFHVATQGDMASHEEVHQRLHVPLIKFYDWLESKLHRSDIWAMTNEEVDPYYQEWLEYWRGTCGNRPCWDCLERRSKRAKWAKERKPRRSS